MSAPAGSRPNFLLFVTDQQRADHLGCYGSQDVATPNIDALSKDGCAFDDFHVATPICQPNRASLMTGRLPSSHGLMLNGRELSFAETTFVEVLREAGWRTALVGKSHLQNITGLPPAWPAPAERLAQDARRPFPGIHGQEDAQRWARDDAFDLSLPYYGFERVSLTIGHGDQQQGHWRRWLREQVPDADALLGPENAIPTPGLALGALRQAWRTRLPEALHPTTWIADQSCAQLRDLAARGEPFFLQCSFPDPHHPFTPPGRYWHMHRPEDVRLPPSFNANLEDPPPPIEWLRRQRARQPSGPVGYATFSCTEQEAREALALNYGNIAFIDHAVGTVIAQLQALGLDDDTVVMFTSDHGDLLGERGLMFKGGLHYNALTRVPFLWRDTRQHRQPMRSAALAQTIDIAPTILERAGLPRVHGMQGRSLMPVANGAIDAVRSALLIEEEGQRRDFGLDARLRMRTLRTSRHRLTLYAGQDWGELYDLHEDPRELRNLWNSHSELRNALAWKLADAMLSSTDASPYPRGAS